MKMITQDFEDLKAIIQSNLTEKAIKDNLAFAKKYKKTDQWVFWFIFYQVPWCERSGWHDRPSVQELNSDHIFTALKAIFKEYQNV